MLGPALLLLDPSTAYSAASIARCRRVRPLRRTFLPWYNVNQEVEHVTLRQSTRDITPLQCSSLVLLSMDPRSHRQFCNEDVAAFREEDRSFGANHFHLRIGFHDLLDACKGKLVDFVVVGFVLELRDLVLPVGHQYVLVGAGEALRDLVN